MPCVAQGWGSASASRQTLWKPLKEQDHGQGIWDSEETVNGHGESVTDSQKIPACRADGEGEFGSNPSPTERTRSEQGWEKIPSNPSCCTCALEPCWDHQGTERGSTLSPPVASATEAAQGLPKGFKFPRESLGDSNCRGTVCVYLGSDGSMAHYLASPKKFPSLTGAEVSPSLAQLRD